MLTIDTDTYLGDFEGFVSYDAEILEFISGPFVVTGGDGMLRVQDIGATSTWDSRSYALVFRAIKVGNCQFRISAPAAYDYDSGLPMSVSSGSQTLSVIAPPTASDNASLEILKISPGTLTPSFSTDVLSYSTIVDNSIKDLVVSAIPGDFKATVAVVGNRNLIVGENEVIITITAESGNKKEYKIKVVKEELIVTDDENLTSDYSTESSLKAEKKNEEVLLIGDYVYTIVKEPSNLSIPEGYKKSSIIIDNITIPIYQFHRDDDYLLMVLRNSFGQIGIYRYDRVEKTIQRYTGERVLIKETESLSNQENEESDTKELYQQSIAKLGILIAVLSTICIILLIGIIRLYLKSRSNERF